VAIKEKHDAEMAHTTAKMMIKAIEAAHTQDEQLAWRKVGHAGNGTSQFGLERLSSWVS